MKDKEQQAEMMLKSLEMMAQSMDTTSSLDEMAKLIAELINFTEQNNINLSKGFENLRSMFVEAEEELKQLNNEKFETLKARLLSQITDKINTVKDGKDGRDGRDGLDGKDGRDGKDLQPETPEQTANRLNTKEEIIEQETIKGLLKRFEDLEERLSKAKGTTNIIGGATGGGKIVKIHDLSDSLNGVLKTFSLPAFWRVLNVYSTSSPVIFRPTVDYTVDGGAMTITFTDEIDAGTTLSSGQTLLILYSEQ